jgi:hypothetical protein
MGLARAVVRLGHDRSVRMTLQPPFDIGVAAAEVSKQYVFTPRLGWVDLGMKPARRLPGDYAAGLLGAGELVGNSLRRSPRRVRRRSKFESKAVK